MIEYKTGDLLILRDGTECIYIENFKKAFSCYQGSINPSTYFDYKCSTYKELDIVKHERDGKVLYKEFKYKKPTEDTPIDTKLLVWDKNELFETVKINKGFYNRHFQTISENNKFLCFVDGLTSFTSDNHLEEWEHAVIYEDGMLD